MTQLEAARKGIVTKAMEEVAAEDDALLQDYGRRDADMACGDEDRAASCGGHFVDGREPGLQFMQRLFPEGVHLGGDAVFLIDFKQIHGSSSVVVSG